MNLSLLGLFKKTYLAGVVAFLGLILIGFGVFEYFRSAKNSAPAVSPAPIQEKFLDVDVEGAVINPGIYKLPLESRVNDALVAASGFDKDADADWVEKNVNLAEKLTDGTKLYIPRKGENAEVKGATSVSTASQTGLVNINKADSKSLEALPGIGPVTAGKIIDGRPYSSVEELSARKILNSKVYAEVKDQLTVN